MVKESTKKVRISAESPPSVCLYTALNASGGLTAADFSDDSACLAVGYGNSIVQVSRFFMIEFYVRRLHCNTYVSRYPRQKMKTTLNISKRLRHQMALITPGNSKKRIQGLQQKQAYIVRNCQYFLSSYGERKLPISRPGHFRRETVSFLETHAGSMST